MLPMTALPNTKRILYSSLTLFKPAENSFIFNRIKRTGRIDHSSSDSQELNCSFGNPVLNSMKVCTVSGVPFGPNVGIFS